MGTIAHTRALARDGYLPLYFTGEAGNICGSATRISSAVFLIRSYAFRSIACKHERENILSACLLPMISTYTVRISVLPRRCSFSRYFTATYSVFSSKSFYRRNAGSLNAFGSEIYGC